MTNQPDFAAKDARMPRDIVTIRRRGGYFVPAVGGGGGGYTAQGVTFDGTNDYLNAASLTGLADGQKGIISFWFKFNGSDGSFQIIMETRDQVSVVFYKDNTNKLFLQLQNSSAVSILLWASTAAYTSAMSGWAHFLGSWDLSVPAASFYITDVADAVPSSLTIGTVNYLATDTNLDLMARSGGTLLVNADVAAYYFNTAEYLDFTNVTNRRKFISAALHPVDLGSDGSTPTGTVPMIFLNGAVASWHTNKNTTAGGFTLTGALTASASNP